MTLLYKISMVARQQSRANSASMFLRLQMEPWRRFRFLLVGCLSCLTSLQPHHHSRIKGSAAVAQLGTGSALSQELKCQSKSWLANHMKLCRRAAGCA